MNTRVKIEQAENLGEMEAQEVNPESKAALPLNCWPSTGQAAEGGEVGSTSDGTYG